MANKVTNSHLEDGEKTINLLPQEEEVMNSKTEVEPPLPQEQAIPAVPPNPGMQQLVAPISTPEQEPMWLDSSMAQPLYYPEIDGPLSPEQEACLDLMLSGNNVFVHCRQWQGDDVIIREFQRRCTRNVVCLSPFGLGASEIGGEVFDVFFNIDSDPIKLNSWPRIRDQKDIQLYKAIDVLLIRDISQLSSAKFRIIYNLLKGLSPNKNIQFIVLGNFEHYPPDILTRSDIRECQSKHGGIHVCDTWEWQMLQFKCFWISGVTKPYFSFNCNFLDDTLPGTYDRLIGEKTYEAEQRDSYKFNPHHYFCNCLYCNEEHGCYGTFNIPYGIVKSAKLEGRRLKQSLPVPESLLLDINAPVIILASAWNPNTNSYEYVAGDIGSIVCDPVSGQLGVKLASERIVDVIQKTWILYKYDTVVTEDNKVVIVKNEITKFTQLPIRQVHKKTVENYIV